MSISRVRRNRDALLAPTIKIIIRRADLNKCRDVWSVTHIWSGWPRPLRIGRLVEIASCGGMLHAASVTAPARLLLSWFWRPPRPHPPNSKAVLPSSSVVRVWLHRDEIRLPGAKSAVVQLRCTTVRHETLIPPYSTCFAHVQTKTSTPVACLPKSEKN